ncbi:acyl-CoA thioesterase [Cupriavidus basilensis]|uniref:4-hydroxybenzoyl-CoA thioesterase n=1 Tax=Cupriavidus basilensis TaxID=68895 RepID=A0A0C4YH29_9BURK|nr:thioesterase family protein [Cupriavidus basilensis]AJG22278.1 4-hydroxybenzoyl-CoA thioesterase [Cupriavidus basilensis]
MRTYRYKRRLHWSECDPGGIVFFPHYSRWMVDGLNEMLFSLGIDPTAILDEKTRGGLPVVQLSMQFFDAPTLHSYLWHEIAVEKIGGKSLGFVHRFLREDTLLMEAHETRVWAVHAVGTTTSMHARVVPESVRALLMGDDAEVLETNT